MTDMTDRVLPPNTAAAPQRHNVVAFPQREPPWHLTVPIPAAVADAIDAERCALGQPVMELIEQRQPSPVYVAGALQALADLAAWLIDVGERQQVEAADRLWLQAFFFERFWQERRRYVAPAAKRRGNP